MKKAFTIIELLVVVLIIGILAAIALPQYRIAVEKSRATEAIIHLRHLADAEELYYLANGGYTDSWDNLSENDPTNSNFIFTLERSIYNVKITTPTSDYYLRYFMKNQPERKEYAGRFLCVTTDNKKLGTQVCKSLSGDPTGFKYQFQSGYKGYFLN